MLRMKWIADTIGPRRLHCEIEQRTLTPITAALDGLVGYYLYIWENGKGLADEVQDDFETAVEGAYKRYGVPKEAWRQVE